MPLDYRRRQIYRLPLAVNDGNFTVEGELVRSFSAPPKLARNVIY
jgi:hypothetical protein